MSTTTVFKSGNSQAVRIPKEYRFSENEVFINKFGDAVFLSPKNSQWANFMLGIDMFSDDYMERGSDNLDNQERESL